MKDIKTLYQIAKRSHDTAAITEYSEAVQTLLESKPIDFLSNLKYIISSDIGLPMLEKFEEKYGLSIVTYGPILECLDECISKCETKGIDATAYKEAKEHYEELKNKYQTCFDMFEYYSNDNIHDGSYLETYYGFNSNGVQNNKLLVGMINEFGESAIADALLTADRIGPGAIGQVLSYVESKNKSKLLDQWLYEACSEVNMEDAKSVKAMERFASDRLEYQVESVLSNTRSYIREALLTGDDNPVMEYSKEDVDNIVDLIYLREYQLTCMEDADAAIELQKKIYSLYEEIDHIVNSDGDPILEDIADSVVPMLPNSNVSDTIAKPMSEDLSWANTRNKKTGNIPRYLGTNHDLTYGEDEVGLSSKQSDQTDEPSIEDLKRASASKSNNEDETSTSDDELDKDPAVGANLTPEEKKLVNNYYYYTYNNSLNKNSHSFNKNDDHSTDNSTHNLRKTDDHSTGKHVNSHNDNTDDHSNDKGDNRDNSVPHSEGFLDIFGKKNNAHIPETVPPTAMSESNDNSFFQQAPHQQMSDGAIHTEAVGDADDNKPESDHPIRDTLMDIDKKSAEVNQKIKRGVKGVGNAGRAAIKPVIRTKQWVTNMINDWKDADENKVKEKMADPKARKNIFSAVGWCIKMGSILKAGLLLNPIFLFLTITKKVGKDRNEYRIRNEMIGELKTELAIIDEKIEDARRNGDNKAKYQLIRLRNEINKKLLRVSGSEGNKRWKKGGII